MKRKSIWIIWNDVDSFGRSSPRAALWRWDWKGIGRDYLGEANTFCQLEPGWGTPEQRRVYLSSARTGKDAKAAALAMAATMLEQAVSHA